MARKDSLIKVRISDDLKAQAEALAEQMGETLSVIVRDALRRYIDQRNRTGSSDALNPVNYMTPPDSAPLAAEPPAHPYSNQYSGTKKTKIIDPLVGQPAKGKPSDN